MTESINPSLPTIGSPAPDFTASSTHGAITLSQYTEQGKWVVLFSHPYDFTPVCSTEFVAFAQNTPRFEERNTQLIGLSVDSVFSHIAWMRSLEQNHDVQVKFPVIADLDNKVGHAYGMIHPGASDMATVRAVFVIDANKTVRALVYYPMTCGRSIDEIHRLVVALQESDKAGKAAPENWKPGEKMILPPPGTTDAAAERLAEHADNPDQRDWYFVKTDQ